MKQLIRLIILILFIQINLYSQETSLVTKVGKQENSIALKWYNEKLTTAIGVDVFRKEENGEWLKINASKIKRGNPKYLNLLKPDTTIYELALDLKNSWNPKGLMLLNVLVKSFESNNLAKYLGICYQDLTVKKGKTYQYKIVDENDKTLVKSAIITINKKEIIPPKDFSLEKNKKEVRIYWLPEVTRYFAVNIYRKDKETENTLINKYPIMASNKQNGEYPEFFYLDQKIKEGKTYTYTLKAIDFFGEESKMTEELQIIIPDNTPPTPPFNLRKIDVRKQDVFLAWKNPSYIDAVGLNIYRGLHSKGKYDKINKNLIPLTDSTYTDIAPQCKDYFYYVASVDEYGNEAPSAKIIINVEDIVPPSTPRGLNAIADTGNIKLKWNKNTEPDLKGYLIYRTIINADSSKYTLLNSTPLIDTFFIDKRPKRAQNKFAYSIVAIDSAFNTSYYSKPVLLKLPDVTPPASPVIKNAISKNGIITIEWIKNVELDLKNYEIFRKSEKETVYMNIGNTKQDYYRDSIIKSDLMYSYTIKAIDTVENSSKRSNYFKVKSSKVQQYNQTLLVNYKIKKKGREINLNWKKNKLKENCRGYVVFYNDKNNSRLKTKLMKNEKIKLSNFSGNTVIVKAYMLNGEIIHSDKIEVLVNINSIR